MPNFLDTKRCKAHSDATAAADLRRDPAVAKKSVAFIEVLLSTGRERKQKSAPTRRAEASADPEPPVIFVVDDDSQLRQGVRSILEEDGRAVEDYPTCEAFLQAFRPGRDACLLIDACVPGMKGLELLQWLRDAGHHLPAIMVTGRSDVPMAVQAMKAGASHCIEKPVERGELLACVARALEQSRSSNKLLVRKETSTNLIASLTPRQRQIMELVVAGHPSKYIAAFLRISQRTVENHRALIMKRTGAKSIPALARLAFAAQLTTGDGPAPRA